MGWMGLIVMEPLHPRAHVARLEWLLAASVIYTLGMVFYLLDERFRHGHGIWHLCVLAGSALHFATLLKFVA